MDDDWNFDAALEGECNLLHGEALRDIEEFAEATGAPQFVRARAREFDAGARRLPPGRGDVRDEWIDRVAHKKVARRIDATVALGMCAA